MYNAVIIKIKRKLRCRYTWWGQNKATRRGTKYNKQSHVKEDDGISIPFSSYLSLLDAPTKVCISHLSNSVWNWYIDCSSCSWIFSLRTRYWLAGVSGGRVLDLIVYCSKKWVNNFVTFVMSTARDGVNGEGIQSNQ